MYFPQVGLTHNKLYGIKQVETAETIIQSLFAKVQLTKKAYSIGHINSPNYPAMQNGKTLLKPIEILKQHIALSINAGYNMVQNAHCASKDVFAPN